MTHTIISRRSVLLTSAFAAASLAVPVAHAQQLAATRECQDGDEPTLSETEGPFFKPKSPERSDLRDEGLKGTPFEITGRVFSRDCKPLGHTVIDLWHADSEGNYDNKGFRCRGHAFTDGEGRYRFLTIVPALYPGRTRHFHVKVQGGGGPLLTTQLYFPNEARNSQDGLFHSQLLMRVSDTESRKTGQFDFVLNQR
jgi:protocatechuate 3,4-dioxygenase beta subunit